MYSILNFFLPTSQIIDVNVWNDMFLPLNALVIHLCDVQTDCATHSKCVSKVHDATQLKISTCL